MNSTPHLTLASNSPRRRQLLAEAGYHFEVRTFPFEEVYPPETPADEVAQFLASGKNDLHRQKLGSGSVILTADTVVIRDDAILEKPGNDQEAFDMLRTLSDGVHRVITGVCISDDRKQVAFSEVTEVTFRYRDDEELHYYIRK